MTARCVAALFSASIIGIAIKASSFAYAQQMPIFGGFEVKTLTKEEKHYQTAAYMCSLKLEAGPTPSDPDIKIVQRTGPDPNQHFPGSGFWIRYVSILNYIQVTVLFKIQCFHFNISLDGY